PHLLKRMPIAYILALVMVVAAAAYVVPRGTEWLGLEVLEADAAQEFIENRARSTGRGGSAFTAPSYTDPAQWPMVVATALFRPFRWEAHNLQAFVQAGFDGGLLVLLLGIRFSSLRWSFSNLHRDPLLVFLFLYMLMYFAAFTAISNFG